MKAPPVKALRPDIAALLGAERFLREIRTAARLQHPHILPVYDSGGTDTLLYYVMPLVEGESLRARLSRERRLASRALRGVERLAILPSPQGPVAQVVRAHA